MDADSKEAKYMTYEMQFTLANEWVRVMRLSDAILDDLMDFTSLYWPSLNSTSVSVLWPEKLWSILNSFRQCEGLKNAMSNFGAYHPNRASVQHMTCNGITRNIDIAWLSLRDLTDLQLAEEGVAIPRHLLRRARARLNAAEDIIYIRNHIQQLLDRVTHQLIRYRSVVGGLSMVCMYNIGLVALDESIRYALDVAIDKLLRQSSCLYTWFTAEQPLVTQNFHVNLSTIYPQPYPAPAKPKNKAKLGAAFTQYPSIQDDVDQIVATPPRMGKPDEDVIYAMQLDKWYAEQRRIYEQLWASMDPVPPLMQEQIQTLGVKYCPWPAKWIITDEEEPTYTDDDFDAVTTCSEYAFMSASPELHEQLRLNRASTAHVSPTYSWWALNQVFARRGLVMPATEDVPWVHLPRVCEHRDYKIPMSFMLNQLFPVDNEYAVYDCVKMYQDDENCTVLMFPVSSEEDAQEQLTTNMVVLNQRMGWLDPFTACIKSMALIEVTLNDAQNDQNLSCVWIAAEHPAPELYLGFTMTPGAWLVMRLYLPERGLLRDSHQQAVQSAWTTAAAVCPSVIEDIICDYIGPSLSKVDAQMRATECFKVTLCSEDIGTVFDSGESDDDEKVGGGRVKKDQCPLRCDPKCCCASDNQWESFVNQLQACSTSKGYEHMYPLHSHGCTACAKDESLYRERWFKRQRT